MALILVVDDNQAIRRTRNILLKRAGHDVEEASSGAEAIQLLRQNLYDLVITDLKLGDVDGLAVLKEAKLAQMDTTEVIVITAFGTVEDGVEAMKQGAFHYIPKNSGNEEILLHVQKAIETKHLHDTVRRYRDRLGGEVYIDHLIGRTPGMRDVANLIRRIASSESTVLILGETGTGKSLIARIIHNMSTRNDKPLVEINCAAIPDTLQESELFGYMKGAFTGADQTKKGLIEEGHQSTVFLDEIGEMSPENQTKLLHFLEQGQIRRVGDTKPIQVDTRVIAATNRDLDVARREKVFREDLYYRLNVITINIPPLRARMEDVPLLAAAILSQQADRMHKEARYFSEDALKALGEYPWPGNVRELENVIERAVLLSTGREITADDLRAYLRRQTPPAQEKQTVPIRSARSRRPIRSPEKTLARLSHLSLEELEREFILYKLKQCDGNQVVTAEQLGIGRTTLWRKLRQYGVLGGEQSTEN